MSTLHFIRLFAIFYCIPLFCLLRVDADNSSKNKPNSGFKMKLVQIEKCKIPANRMFKDAPMQYSVASRKMNRSTTIILTHVSVTAREGPIFFTVRGYQVQPSSSKDLILMAERVTCNNLIIIQLLKLIRAKLDKDCYAMPGNYSASISIDDFKYLFTKAVVGSGVYSYDLEFDTNKGIAACVSMTCEVTK